MRILVAGGAGYVGSHVVRECRRVGHEVVVFDNYSTGHADAVDGVEQVSGDIREPKALRALFENFRFSAVIHLASSHSAHETRDRTAASMQTIVGGTLNLARAMTDAAVERLVYGSSAAVTANPSSDLGFAHRSAEELLSRLAQSHALRFVALRMFAVAGADLAGDIGEDHRPESHLVPRLFRSALGLGGPVTFRGDGFDTPDRSAVRDYVHVTDVARAHLLAIDALESTRSGAELAGRAIDVATGLGLSEREIVAESRGVVDDLEIQTTMLTAEPGTPASVIGDPDPAQDLLGWEPQFSDRETILRTAWAWHRRHPSGFTLVRTDPADSDKAQRFGAVAVRLGFATESDVQRALDRQMRESQEGGEHKLIGLHMLELGILSTSQLISILRSYEESTEA